MARIIPAEIVGGVSAVGGSEVLFDASVVANSGLFAGAVKREETWLRSRGIYRALLSQELKVLYLLSGKRVFMVLMAKLFQAHELEYGGLSKYLIPKGCSP